MNKDLQNEIDALVKLGQTGVHTVTRSQAFKDTGWHAYDVYHIDHSILVSLGDGNFEGRLHEAESLTRSPEGELEELVVWITSEAEGNEFIPLCHIESLRSSEGQECVLFTKFYSQVWESSRMSSADTVDACDWIVFPSQEELDLFFLRKNQFLYPSNDRLNKDLLRKWNEENREFWKKIYEYHEKWSLDG